MFIMRMDRLVVVACLFVTLIPIATATRNLGSSGHGSSLELRELLKRLNKSPRKSVQSPDGDIVDCIMINQQPAFDHDALQNHVIQMRPTSEPKGKTEESNDYVSPLWLAMNDTCPEGTVPIRRTKEEDLLRTDSLQDYGKKKFMNSSSTHNPTDFNPRTRHEYAVVDVGLGNYRGAQATINLWKPQVQQPQEFSLSQMWIVAGTFAGGDLNTIEVGWHVYPKIYGDSNPRLFTFWTVDGYKSTGCYNLLCPGFVQVSRRVFPGAAIAPVSVYGARQNEITIKVWKDQPGQKWWVKVGNEVVGYWPTSVFSTLENAGTDVKFGGEIVNLSSNGHTTTTMGSGHFAGEGFGKASYFKRIQTIDSNNNMQDPVSLTPFTTNSNCYDVKTGKSPLFGTFFFYGGPGKNPRCP